MADLTIAGKKVSKPVVFGIGGLVFVGGFLLWRKKNAAAASANTASTDTSGTDTSNIDPQTGYPYGSAEDQAALSGDTSGLYGYGDTSGLQYGIDPGTGQPGYYDPASGGWIDTGTGTTSPTPASATTNAAWAQAAEAQLAGTVDPATLSAALGKYLTGQPMTSDQVNLADQAIAVEGYPPQSGPGGYPPAMHNAASGGGQGGGKVTVPAVTGDRVENANSALHAAGLKSTFGARKPGVPYTVTGQNPRAGAKVAKGATVHLTIKAQSLTPELHG